MKNVLPLVLFSLLWISPARADTWFETFKAEASAADLQRFLYLMPKGGDLHMHITGSVFSEWYYDLALGQAQNEYHYLTKVRINNCEAMHSQQPRRTPYLLLYQTVEEAEYLKLDDCERGEYVALRDLNDTQKQRWLDSIRLNLAHEGRDEFFERHWQRINSLVFNPYLVAELLYRNMRAFADEGVMYMEPQVPVFGFRAADGTPMTPAQVFDIFNQRLNQADAKATGVEWRYQVSLLRFLPNAEAALSMLYRIAAEQPNVVAVNMVGREDNDKGYPLRFLNTLRELRREHHGVKLSIHAGEVDEPNYHVRDTILLGADRIGHGVNLITDPDTMRLFRHGPYLVEINLISNLLLEYINDYSEHPFPEYLRTGIPVALSTDDRGMWDSTMTDEFFVAVNEFNLSWQELVTLSRNSLQYSFTDEATKTRMLTQFDKRIKQFVTRFKNKGVNMLKGVNPPRRGFICRQYQLCPES